MQTNSWFRPNQSALKASEPAPSADNFYGQHPHHHPFGYNHLQPSQQHQLTTGNEHFANQAARPDPGTVDLLSRSKGPTTAMHAMPHMSQTPGTGHGHHLPGTLHANGIHHQPSPSTNSSNSKPVKVKRTRQRVDAGEPRNSYASIANFSSRGGYHGYNSHKYHHNFSNHNTSGGSSSSNSGGASASNANLHPSHLNSGSSAIHHLQSHSIAATGTTNSGSSNTQRMQPHHSQQQQQQLNSPDQMFLQKQFRDQASSFNAAAVAAAAAASRPDIMMDPAILQMCQNQMAALFNSAYTTPPSQVKPANKLSPQETQEQFALNNAIYNANAFLSQLQSPDNSIATFMNNLSAESAAAALFGTNPASAQLLRDILEAGRGNEKAQQTLSNKLASQQQYESQPQQQSPQNAKYSKSKSSTKRFSESEFDFSKLEECLAAGSMIEHDEEGICAVLPSGVDELNNEADESIGGSGDVDNREETQRLSDNEDKEKKATGIEGELSGDGDAETEEDGECEGGESRVSADRAKEEAKDNERPGGSDCGRSKDNLLQLDCQLKEAAKTAASRDGNSAKEERRGRGRPPLHSLAQRRAKSSLYTLAPGAAANATSPLSSCSASTSLGDPASSASFVSKNASCAELELLEHLQVLDQIDPTNTERELAAAVDEQDDLDQLSLDDSSHSEARSSANQSQAKRARVENIVSNMLLVTSSNPATTGVTAASSPTNVDLSPIKNTYIKSDDDMETESNSIKPPAQGVNGCKKRKLYQPQQQSSKLQNGNLDTDDDIEEVVTAPEVGDVIGVEAELDEGYDDSDERKARLSPQSRAEVPSKELDLSSSNTPVASAATNSQPRIQMSRSEHLPTKRSRMSSDYEREYKLQQLQSQLYSMQQKYALQLYAQQQQQQQLQQQQQQQQQQQSKSNVNGSSHYQRASPVNMTAATECDTNVAEDKQAEIKLRQSGQPLTKIYDVDLLIESLKGQILSSIGQIIDSTFRCHLEAHTRYTFEGNSKENNSSKPNELLAQMLDGKYSRVAQAKSVSPAAAISANKNSDRDVSPFALPSEASTAPKPFAYPQSGLGTNFYSKQPFYLPTMAPQTLASYPNLNSRDNTSASLLLNGFRETPSTNSSSSNLINFTRDDASPVLPEQTEAISLVVAPKKRRNKVTDSRPTPRTVTRIPRDDRSSVSPPIMVNGQMHPFSSPSLAGVPVSLASLQSSNDFFDQGATAFPFADQSRLSSFFGNGDDSDLKNGLSNGMNGTNGSSNPSVVSAVAQAAAAHHLQMLAASRASPDSLNGYPGSLLTSFGRGSGTGSENGGDGSDMNDTQSMYDPNMPMTSTLSPMHLRKAKLMFFYVRYPSSSILKMFFPDIKFNKNNTAQLVKWFSNFREFYYIQMEKYARQALSEGVKNGDELTVTDDCELLRVLNLHYNRSNHIPIPDNFRTVSETTLREFFKSLQQNKDSEQSWKKAIYKVIARLDDNVPDYFKNPNFMEQLE